MVTRFQKGSLAAVGALFIIWLFHVVLSPWGLYDARDLAPAIKPDKPSSETSPKAGSNSPATKPSSSSSSSSNVQLEDRPLIVYAYHESDSARENLKFFLNEGLSGAADFIFIINGETEDSNLIPRLPHVRVVERPNTCFDLGSFGEVLRTDNLYKKYNRFITINASVRGPFMPRWATGKICWMDAFLNKLSDRTKLVGTTWNCQEAPHIQSMVFATDSVGMAIMVNTSSPNDGSGAKDTNGNEDDPVAFRACYETMGQAIHAEVGTARLIRHAGYEVDGLMAAISSYANPEAYCEDEDARGLLDVQWNGKYYGFNVHPYEIVFIKANRDIDGAMMDRLTDWHRRDGWNSWQACGLLPKNYETRL